MKSNPINSSNRIIFLDILRGLAILFIFIANCYTFSGWWSIPDDITSQMNGSQINSILKQLTAVFIDGKWYSIFSILFGIGFVIQYENAQAKNQSFPAFFSKRMFGLLFFGLIHLFFLWVGDILTLYALTGFILIYFRNHGNKQLLIWSGVLLLMPVVHLLLMIGFDNFYPLLILNKLETYFLYHKIPFEVVDGQFDLYAFAKTWIESNTWKDFFTINFGMPLMRTLRILMEGRIFKVLACFLIGIWTGRMILKNDILQNKSLLKKIAVFGFLIGIPMNILLAVAKTQSGQYWTIINFVSYAFGVVPLACAYVASLALLLNSGHKYLSIFAPVGQMAMSNYIFQTIISILIFYGVGLGLAFKTPLWQVLLIVLLIYLLQIIFSTVWLRHFRFGPLEWLWRMMTYQKYISNRK